MAWSRGLGSTEGRKQLATTGAARVKVCMRLGWARTAEGHVGGCDSHACTAGDGTWLGVGSRARLEE